MPSRSRRQRDGFEMASVDRLLWDVTVDDSEQRTGLPPRFGALLAVHGRWRINLIDRQPISSKQPTPR